MTDFDEVGPWGPAQAAAAAELVKRHDAVFDAIMTTVRDTTPVVINSRGWRSRRFSERAVYAAPLGLRIDHTAVRLWLEQHGTTATWGSEEWRRTGTDSVCQTCGEPLMQHLHEYGPGYGLAGDEVLHLHRDCAGNLFHL